MASLTICPKNNFIVPDILRSATFNIFLLQRKHFYERPLPSLRDSHSRAGLLPLQHEAASPSPLSFSQMFYCVLTFEDTHLHLPSSHHFAPSIIMCINIIYIFIVKYLFIFDINIERKEKGSKGILLSEEVAKIALFTHKTIMHYNCFLSTTRGLPHSRCLASL